MYKSLFRSSAALFVLSFSLTFSFAQGNGGIKGITVSGIKGEGKSLSQVIQFEREHPLPHNFKAPLHPELEGPELQRQNPEAKPVSRFGATVTSLPSTTTTSLTTKSAFSNFLAIWGSYALVTGRESPYTPPDNCGDVGSTQIVVTANCRMKAFTKPAAGTAAKTSTGSSTTTLTAVLNVDLNAFFTNTALGINSISDPHVRFDRLSGRWFIVAIDVNHNTNNYCCIGVSDGPTLSSSSNFKIYYFNVSGTGGSSRDFFDFPTLGVDKNSLYIGGNMFANGSNFSGCNFWVVNKANLLATTPTLTVTSFPYSITHTDMYTPQGVHNDYQSATLGYFIGASQTVYSKLNIRRVSYSGTTPLLSADLPLATATTYTPRTVPTRGGTAIDGGDSRLFAAMIKKNKITGTANLWVAQGTLINSSGIGGSGGDRDGVLWMEIGNLSTTPSVVQGATLYDGTNTNATAVSYIYPTIALNGQGHNLMGFSSAGPANYANAAIACRYRTDATATFRYPVNLTASSSTYNPGASRWGDFTQTVVDPVDDMTLWTFSEYTATTNSWGVRAAQLLAPPPATPALASPPACGISTITINGTSVNNAEFFDPGSSTGAKITYRHLQVSVTGPSTVAVSNVKFVNPTQITATVNLTGASSGTYTLKVTNPDKQTASTTFTLSASCPLTQIITQSNVNGVIEEGIIKAKFYPNPTSSLINIELASQTRQLVYLEVYDLSGKMLISRNTSLEAGMNFKQLSLANFISGTYVIQIRNEHNTILASEKVIKK